MILNCEVIFKGNLNSNSEHIQKQVHFSAIRSHKCASWEQLLSWRWRRDSSIDLAEKETSQNQEKLLRNSQCGQDFAI